MWDIESGQCIKVLSGHEDWVVSLAYSPDGKHIAFGTAMPANVLLWDIESGEPIKIFSGHEIVVNRVAYSPDGKTIASGSNGVMSENTIRLWDTKSGDCLEVIEGGMYGDTAKIFAQREVVGGVALALTPLKSDVCIKGIGVLFWPGTPESIATAPKANGAGFYVAGIEGKNLVILEVVIPS